MTHHADVEPWVPPAEIVADFRKRARPRLKAAPTVRFHGFKIDSLQTLRRKGFQPSQERRLEQRPKLRVVLGRHEVQRRAHGRRANYRPLVDAAREVFALKSGQPCPEPDVRRTGQLRLQADEALHRAGNRARLTRKQHLPRKGRAIEVAERHGSEGTLGGAGPSSGLHDTFVLDEKA